jgi:hypothetical protein
VKFLAAMVIAVVFVFTATIATADTKQSQTYQGKSIKWWAKHTVQARKDANARAGTIKRLKKTMAHNTTIAECVKLATIAYPDFTEGRAWKIIGVESKGNPNAKNPHSTASGLFQFLTSTFASTPYGRAGMSIWSPCASALAAGWMHQNGRGGEWAY